MAVPDNSKHQYYVIYDGKNHVAYLYPNKDKISDRDLIGTVDTNKKAPNGKPWTITGNGNYDFNNYTKAIQKPSSTNTQTQTNTNAGNNTQAQAQPQETEAQRLARLAKEEAERKAKEAKALKEYREKSYKNLVAQKEADEKRDREAREKYIQERQKEATAEGKDKDYYLNTKYLEGEVGESFVGPNGEIYRIYTKDGKQSLVWDKTGRGNKGDFELMSDPPEWFVEMQNGIKDNVAFEWSKNYHELYNKGDEAEDINENISNILDDQNSTAGSYVNSVKRDRNPFKYDNDNINLNVNVARNVVDNFYGDEHDYMLRFKIPQWGYLDFFNERAMFQKGLSSLFNETGYFYFKVFFDFSNPYGLFGNIHRNASDFSHFGNSAIKYLYYLQSSRRYGMEYIEDRIVALKKFASILQYISTNAPWFFSGISGLQDADKIIMDDFSKTRQLTIQCNPDAIDMRLSTMIDLYRFACYDSIAQKEIIPSNIRKFDMTIILFETPLKFFHNSITVNGGKPIKTKTLGSVTETNGNTMFDNAMTYKMYTFMGCEISKDTFTSVSPSNVKNDNPFKIENISIKIDYERCYIHTQNEFFHFMFGSDGFHNKNITVKSSKYTIKDRCKALQDALYSNNWKSVVESSEYIMHGLHTVLSPTAVSNEQLDYTDAFTSTTKAELGTLYGDVGIGSATFKAKMQKLLNNQNSQYVKHYDKGMPTNGSDAYLDFLPDEILPSTGKEIKGFKQAKLEQIKKWSHNENFEPPKENGIWDTQQEGYGAFARSSKWWVYPLLKLETPQKLYISATDQQQLHNLSKGTLNSIKSSYKYFGYKGNIELKSTSEKMHNIKHGTLQNVTGANISYLSSVYRQQLNNKRYDVTQNVYNYMTDDDVSDIQKIKNGTLNNAYNRINYERSSDYWVGYTQQLLNGISNVAGKNNRNKIENIKNGTLNQNIRSTQNRSTDVNIAERMDLKNELSSGKLISNNILKTESSKTLNKQNKTDLKNDLSSGKLISNDNSKFELSKILINDDNINLKDNLSTKTKNKKILLKEVEI